MAKIELEDLIKYTYTRLPPIFITKDLEISQEHPPLYNFMRSMFAGHNDSSGSYEMGAGELVLQRMNNFVNLIDPEKCPDEWFPFLYESFGLTYNPLIEEMRPIYDPNNPMYTGPYNGQVFYHRKFLSNIGALLKRRGTLAGLRFLVRTLTGFEFQYSYKRGYVTDSNGEQSAYGRHITINLIVSDAEKDLELENSKKVIEQFLTPFLPHYITLFIGDSVTYTTMEVSQGIIPVMPYSTSYNAEVRVEVDETKTGEEDII